MVFNWFRRQFGNSDGSSEETSTETPQVEQEQEVTEEQESGVADDDLLNWAKTAYKNIQKQQEEATEPQEEPSTPEMAEAIPEEESASEQPTVAESEVEITTEAAEPTTGKLADQTVEETAPTAETLSEASPDAVSVESQEEIAESEPEAEAVESPVVAEASEAEEAEIPVTTESVTVESAPPSTEEPTTVASTEQKTSAVPPITEDPTSVESETLSPVAAETESAPTTPVPIWARSSAERQARLERLKETAIELPEPEPIRVPVQPVEPATTTRVKGEVISGLAFDEGFMWSAQVLAAQGRRPEDVSVEEISWLNRLRQGLDKTRRSLINQLKAIVGQGPLNQDAVMEIEALLLQADVGVEATDYIINTLQQKLREEVLPPEQALAYLKQIIRDLLDRPLQESYSPTFVPEKDTLNIWLMTGVNGAGKTTTIGKLAHLAQKSGYRCLIGAADTFRAAAVEQVKIWGERSGTEVIANPGKNTDPAAVVFDAITAAQARNTELLLIDTAGRLQNKKNLMEELAKIRRIIDKKAPDTQVESLLVLDATLGQNGLRQAEVFSQAAKLSGVVLTKLDGTAKGGVALAVVQQLGLPIRFIGAGEGIEDLRPFSSYEFVEALLSG
ncbi:signal recognition particle-docking protein FtsY [Allocoleopsis franciscana]|uniref:Signal recognition particle receptor FtsY n=1 Tax=Allocoleopsis franciscana PCC 7113 TaxID=1173027 RepID=K9WA20_9CYAN|nr:signal recognition particle-docking protein FtsY [Allocoleopsis franciscana]AFZ17240.1 signal recognition particle-docking protein FtsY [Allocoleopsis franciscana PCC 7113]